MRAASRFLTTLVALGFLGGVVAAAVGPASALGVVQQTHRAIGGTGSVASWEKASALLRALKYDPSSLGRADVDAADVERLLVIASDNSPDDVWVRQACLGLLASLGSERAMETLAGALRDPSPQVRHAAAMGLASLGDARAVEPLLSELATGPDDAVARALMQIDDPSASQHFVRGLQGPSPTAVTLSALWLGQSGDTTAVQPLLGVLRREDAAAISTDRVWSSGADAVDGGGYRTMSPAEAAGIALAEIADSASVEPLIEIATSASAVAGRQAAIVALSRIGGREAVSPLVSLLRDPAVGIRQVTALALADVHEPEVGDALLGATGDRDPIVGLNAGASLLSQGRAWPDALAVSSRWLRDPGAREDVLAAAVRVAALTRDPVAVPPLVDILDRTGPSASSARLQRMAVLALGVIGGDRAIGTLSDTSARGTSEELRLAALVALGDLDSPLAEAPLTTLLDQPGSSFALYSTAMSSLQKIDPPFAEHLVMARLRESPDNAFRQAALIGLAASEDPAVTQLQLSALRSAEPEIRYAALEGLMGKSAQPEVTQALVSLLRSDSDPLVRSQAALGLETVEDAAAQSALSLALRDPHPQVRNAAALALAPLADAEQLREMRPLLSDPNPRVRQAAVLAFGIRADELPESSVILAAGLKDPSWRVQQTTVMAMGAALSALPALRQPLTSLAADPSRPFAIRQNVLLSLASLDQPEARSLLTSSLSSPDWRLRQASVIGLGRSDDPAVVSALRPLTRDGVWQVRQAAAVSLASFAQPAAVEALSPLLGDPQWQVRQAAVAALGRVGDAAVASPLRDALRDGHPEVRRAALGALIPSVAQPEIRQLFVTTLASDADPLARSRAALGLQGVDAPDAGRALRLALKDPVPQVRSAAVLSLAQLKDPGATDALRPMIADPRLDVREAAILSLGLRARESPQSVDDLLPGLQDSNWRIREATATGLGASLVERPSLKSDLLGAAVDASQPIAVRESALLALSRLEQPEVGDLLIQNLGSADWRLRQTAAIGLGNHRTPEVATALKPLARDQQWQVRQAAAASLGGFDRMQVSETLAPLLKDPSWQVRQVAAASFDRVDDPTRVAALTPLLNDHYPSVRLAAAQALSVKPIATPEIRPTWTSSPQLMANQLISNAERQCDEELVATYSERLLQRDVMVAASYGIDIAGMIPGGAPTGVVARIAERSAVYRFMADPMVNAGRATVSVVLDVVSDTGTDSARRTADRVGNVATGVGIGWDLAILNPTGALTGWMSSELRRSGNELIAQPVWASSLKPVAIDDGFTRISGVASVNMSYTQARAPVPLSASASILDDLVGTTTVRSGMHWTTQVGPAAGPSLSVPTSPSIQSQLAPVAPPTVGVGGYSVPGRQQPGYTTPLQPMPQPQLQGVPTPRSNPGLNGGVSPNVGPIQSRPPSTGPAPVQPVQPMQPPRSILPPSTH